VVVHDLVVEHGEVQGETESNGVASVEALGEILSLLVALEGTALDLLELAVLGGFGDVSVVVTDHLLEEGLGLVILSELEAVILNDLDDLDALSVELLLDLSLVLSEGLAELGVLGVLLNGADSADPLVRIQLR